MPLLGLGYALAERFLSLREERVAMVYVLRDEVRHGLRGVHPAP